MSGSNFDPDSLLNTPAPASATMKITPVMQDILNNVIAPGESSGSYNVIYGGKKIDDLSQHPDIPVPIKSGPNAGLNSTAAGKYQFINSTWKEAEKALGLKDFGPESQDAAAAWLAKKTYAEKTGGRDIEADYASGDPSLKAGIKRALASQWESLGKGGPRSEMALGNDRASFHQDLFSGDNTHLMSPEDYLALSPPMESTPEAAKQWRDLRASVGAGEPIFKAPTLDMTVDGSTGKVTAQDGRNRALLAQEAGLDAIPVQINQTGQGTPTEIKGMAGNTVPADRVTPASQVAIQKQGGSLIGRMLGIGTAEAAEPKTDDEWETINPPAKASATDEEEWTPVNAPGALPSVAQMSEDEARAANLSPVQQREWIDAQQSRFGQLPAAVMRGVAPYVAGAATGAAIGAPFAGVGAIPGAIAGAGAVGLDQLATGLSGLTTPQNLTDRGLDVLGVQRPQNAIGRTVENAAGGAANAFSGAGAAGLLVNSLKNPTAKAVALMLSQAPSRQGLAGALGSAASQIAAELGLGPAWQAGAGFLGGMVPGGGNAMRSLARGTGNLASHVIGGIGTHTGAEPIKEAFRAGAEGGERSATFLEALRDKAPQEKIVETAKDALDAMRKSRNAAYQSGMVNINKDATQLDFAPLNKALGSVGEAAEYAGKVTNEEAAGKLETIKDVVKDWQSGDPAVFHTPQGFDALKRRIGEIWQSTTPHTQARLIVGRAYDAIKDTIVKQAPAYAGVMKDYEEASDALRELESAFSLREKNSVDTALRKLQSVMRNNVNTGYGHRAALANTLNDLSGGQLNPQVAGRALSSVTPRGLGNVVAWGTALAALAHPAALAALPFESPRAVGEAAHFLGKVSGYIPAPSGNMFSTAPAAARAAGLGSQQQ